MMLNRLASRAPRAARALSSTSLTRPALIASTQHPLTSTASTPTSHHPSCQQPTTRRHYHEKVLDHYSSPRNVGSMPKGAADVGTGLVGAPACGDVMKLQIKVDPATDTITDVKFKTFGCGSAIASSSYMTELVRGMTLEKAGQVKNTEIARELCLPPVKLHCSMLAEDAIKSAISNYYSKNPKAKETDLGVKAASPMPEVEVERVVQDGPGPPPPPPNAAAAVAAASQSAIA